MGNRLLEGIVLAAVGVLVLTVLVVAVAFVLVPPVDTTHTAPPYPTNTQVVAEDDSRSDFGLTIKMRPGYRIGDSSFGIDLVDGSITFMP